MDFLVLYNRNSRIKALVFETGSFSYFLCSFSNVLLFNSYFNRQLLDLPGIIEGAKDGKGRGRQVNDIFCSS